MRNETDRRSTPFIGWRVGCGRAEGRDAARDRSDPMFFSRWYPVRRFICPNCFGFFSCVDFAFYVVLLPLLRRSVTGPSPRFPVPSPISFFSSGMWSLTWCMTGVPCSALRLGDASSLFLCHCQKLLVGSTISTRKREAEKPRLWRCSRIRGSGYRVQLEEVGFKQGYPPVSRRGAGERGGRKHAHQLPLDRVGSTWYRKFCVL